MDDITDFINLYYNIKNDKTDNQNKNILNDFEIVDKNDINLPTSSFVEIDVINENDINNYFQQTDQSNVFLFEMKLYLNDILKSYRYDLDNIWDQLNKDVPRSNIFINDRQIYTDIEFKQKLKKLDVFKDQYNNCVFSLFEILATLTTQASYAFPFIFLHKKYCDDIDSKYKIQGLSTNRRIDINTRNENITMTIEADFSIFNTDTNKSIRRLNTCLMINTNIVYQNGYYTRSNLEPIGQYGVLNITESAM